MSVWTNFFGATAVPQLWSPTETGSMRINVPRDTTTTPTRKTNRLTAPDLTAADGTTRTRGPERAPDQAFYWRVRRASYPRPQPWQGSRAAFGHFRKLPEIASDLGKHCRADLGAF